MTIYMKCTTDRLELPIAVADTAKVVIDEPKLYPTADGGLWYKDPDTWETVYVEG